MNNCNFKNASPLFFMIVDMYYTYESAVNEREDILKKDNLTDSAREYYERTLEEAKSMLEDVKAVYEFLLEREKKKHNTQ